MSSRSLLRFTLIFAAALAVLGAPALPGGPVAFADDTDDAAAALAAQVKTHLDKAQVLVDKVTAVTGPRTPENTLEPMNQVSLELSDAGNYCGLMENVHPDEVVRTAAEKGSQDVSAFATSLSLNRAVYDALAAVDVGKADAETKRLVEHSLRDYRRSGVDKDEATREKIKKLNEELVEIGQEFSRHIRDGRREVYVNSAAELDGLPQDYIDGHQPAEDGRIAISTDYPDYIPVMTYAKNGDLRMRLYHEYLNRGYPENKDTFKRLLEKRYELAQTLGYKDWATYITEDKMVKTPENAAAFIEQLNTACLGRAGQDYDMLLERKHEDDPAAMEVFDYEKSYYSELVKGEKFAFDSQQLRAYYNYPAVKDGILNLCATLFGVEFRRVPDAAVWYPDVECYDLYEDGVKQGRFYLDMHPREGKYNHAAQFPLQTGISGVREPQAVLVCNLPAPNEAGVGLMEQDDVETFLHEFGHLLHTLFGGHHRWADQSGIATEWDFVEAPSQMLEEWAEDPKTLQTFARHYETGKPIPSDLIEKLRAAKEFGNGIYVRQQTFYTAISLNAYNRPPDQVDMDKLVPELQGKYSNFSYVPDTHMYASFGHLEGYSAMYYTYMWSLVIAKDLFSQFHTGNLLDPTIATRYRKQVLEPGGTMDAADLVKQFLGRPYSFDAFARWLNGTS